MIFNPKTALASAVKQASNSIGAYFDEIGSSVEDGGEIDDAVRGMRIQKAMQTAIAQARIQGFLHAAKHSKKQMPAFYGSKIRQIAENRSKRVNRWMKQTTKRVLSNSPDSEHVLSKARAQAAVRYEAGRQYFKGVQDGFGGTGKRKSWITTSENPCENCQDNEDAGPIDVDDFFPSGDYAPLLHQHCQCMMAIHK